MNNIYHSEVQRLWWKKQFSFKSWWSRSYKKCFFRFNEKVFSLYFTSRWPFCFFYNQVLFLLSFEELHSCIALIFVLVEISIVLFAWKAHVFELTAALLALVFPFLARSWFLHMSTYCMFFFVHSCLSSLCSDNFEYKCCPSVCLQPLQTQYCLNSLCSP